MCSPFSHQCLPLAHERAIWSNHNNSWMIGSSSDRGSGYAYNSNDYNCPYDPAYDWKYTNYYNNWADAGDFLKKFG